MKNMRIMTALGVLCLGLVVIGTGCQTSGKLVSTETSSVCPTCQMETRTTSITGVTYSKCICPSCKTVSTVDPRLAETVRGYVGDEIGDTVHVCDHCKAIAEKCPVCRKTSR